MPNRAHARIKLFALDAAYAAGDVARLKIVLPAAGETLVLIESNQLLWRHG